MYLCVLYVIFKIEYVLVSVRVMLEVCLIDFAHEMSCVAQQFQRR